LISFNKSCSAFDNAGVDFVVCEYPLWIRFEHRLMATAQHNAKSPNSLNFIGEFLSWLNHESACLLTFLQNCRVDRPLKLTNACAPVNRLVDTARVTV